MITRIQRGALIGVFFGLMASSPGLLAQDVERVGRRYGTRPPQAYFDRMARDPGAYQFSRALFRVGLGQEGLSALRTEGQFTAASVGSGLARLAAEGPRRTSVAGTFGFPLILGLFSDTEPLPSSFDRAGIQAEFFDGPQAHPSAMGTVPDYYEEVSGGLVNLVGTTFDWQTVALTQAEVTGGQSALGSSAKIGEFIVKIIQALDDGSVDWGVFDNDGPDGLPNSGDDDGYVDVLAVMHPTAGAECGGSGQGDRIWSHRWNLFSAASSESGTWALQVIFNGGYVTQTPIPGGGMIRIDDYTVQPVVDCSGRDINAIGTMAHELGHGFGLPDLYNTGRSYNHSGIGTWGLMGSGSWGCDDDSEWSPCHMSPWSKSALGWGDVEILAPDQDLGSLVLPPVESSGKIYRLDAGDGSGEYLLLENRQREGFDQYLHAPGLLAWHIDPAWIATHPYSVNADKNHMGVWLRQADGWNSLGQNNGGRGDNGDPFPGSTGNTVFHAGSDPASWTHQGDPFGVTLLNIQQSGLDMSFQALSRYQTLTFRTNGSPTGGGMITVDGVLGPSLEWAIESAPYQTHAVEASSGVALGEGLRVAFQNWNDGAERTRDYTTSLEDATLTATYGGREVHLQVELTSPVLGLTPGHIDFMPGDAEGWVPEGGTVAITAVPRTGFGFLEWSGAFLGMTNPATLTADAPMDAGAAFEVTFSADANPPLIQVSAATQQTIALQVANANFPVTWTLLTGDVPQQMRFNPTGFITGVPMVRGSFPLSLQVQDDLGLQDQLSVTLEIVDVEASLEVLASPFLSTGQVVDANQRAYLDSEGNQNGAYDLGDFRAYLLRNPDLLLAVELSSAEPLGSVTGGEAGREELP